MATRGSDGVTPSYLAKLGHDNHVFKVRDAPDYLWKGQIYGILLALDPFYLSFRGRSSRLPSDASVFVFFPEGVGAIGGLSEVSADLYGE